MINWTVVLWTMIVVLSVGFVISLPYLSVLFARLLASAGIIFVIAEERRALLIERNGKFRKAIMSVTGHRWRGGTNRIMDPVTRLQASWENRYPDANEWDIILDSGTGLPRGRLQTLAGGLHVLGFPIMDRVKKYWFTWTSKEQVKHEGEDIRYQYKTEKELIGHVLVLQDDVYYIEVKNAEDANGVPLRIVLAVTGQVFNPYKAVYGTVHWLETLGNQLGDRVRGWTRTQAYEEMDRERDAISRVLSSHPILEQIARNYGVWVRLVQLDQLDPSPEYRQLTTAKYEADQKAAMRVRAGEAERSFLESTVGYVGGDAGRRDAFKWQNVAQLRGTYVEGGGKDISIAVPASTEKPEEPPKK